LLPVVESRRKATSGVPGRFQAAVEILIEMVDSPGQGHRSQCQQPQAGCAIGAVVFVWIFLLNAMDLLPLDLLPMIWKCHIRRCRDMIRTTLSARRAYGGFVGHHGYVSFCPAGLLGVQHQDQGYGWLGA
jgi:F0F1-type ATP synthase membrane subunit a